MSKSREQLVQYLSEIDITDKVVLDAGCGDKSKWARNFTKGEPSDYTTCDVDDKHKPDFIFDLNKFKQTYPMWTMKGIMNIGKEYAYQDVVFCIETLEHLWNPLNALKSFYSVLRKNGKLYLSTPFINPYHDEVDYARYTSEWYQKVLTEVGFKDIKIKPRLATEGLPHLLQFYKLEGLRMSKTRLQKGQQDKMAEIGYFVEATK